MVEDLHTLGGINDAVRAARRGPRLLSYVFFDRDYIEASIKLGIEHAVKVTQAVGVPFAEPD